MASRGKDKKVSLERDADNFLLLSRDMLTSYCRLAFLAFYLDMFFYYLDDRRSSLRYEALKYSMPCSEQLWEAQTPDQWQSIKDFESNNTAHIPFAEYIDQAMDATRRPALPHLVEDEFLYGLCALQSMSRRDSSRKSFSFAPTLRSNSAVGIAYWTLAFDSWKEEYRKRRAHGPILSSANHARHIDMNAMPLYYLSQIELRSEMAEICELSLLRQPLNTAYQEALQARVAQWSGTAHARWAMWYAVQVLRMMPWAEESGTRETQLEASSNLLAQIALYRCGLIAWAYSRFAPSTCVHATEHEPGSTLIPFFAATTPDLFSSSLGLEVRVWIEHGGEAFLKGGSLCFCNIGRTLGCYESALRRNHSNWRCGRYMAEALSRLKN